MTREGADIAIFRATDPQQFSAARKVGIEAKKKQCLSVGIPVRKNLNLTKGNCNGPFGKIIDIVYKPNEIEEYEEYEEYAKYGPVFYS